MGEEGRASGSGRATRCSFAGAVGLAARSSGRGTPTQAAAGLDNTVIPWLKKRDIALLSWETPGYVPQPPGDLPRLALHNFVLSHLGVMLIDRGDFDALADVAAARNRWEFMLTVGAVADPERHRLAGQSDCDFLRIPLVRGVRL